MSSSPLVILTVALLATVSFVCAQSQERKTPIAAAATSTTPCYQCNSLTPGQEKCSSSEVDDLKPFLKTCPKITEGQLLGRTATACRKILQEVHEQEGVIRECAYTGEDELDGKRRIGNLGIILYLYQCFNEDGKACNSAPGHGSSVFMAFAFTAVAALFSGLCR